MSDSCSAGGLGRKEYEVRVFDTYRGPVVDLLRRRYLGSRTSPRLNRLAGTIRSCQIPAEQTLRRARLIRPRADDICAERAALAARFAGSYSVVHLAGIPHPFWPGATADDFHRINDEAAVNVFEAARDADVEVFVFASSAQVYRINAPVWVTQFPIRNAEHLPLPSEGQTDYGYLKAAFERYLAGACQSGGTRAIALRLEYPGFRSRGPENLYISTSIENVARAFKRALAPPSSLRFEAFNIADAHVDDAIVDIQAILLVIGHEYRTTRAATNRC